MCSKSKATHISLAQTLCAWKHFTINWKVYWIIFTGSEKVETVRRSSPSSPHITRIPFIQSLGLGRKFNGRRGCCRSFFTWLTTLNTWNFANTYEHRSQIHFREREHRFGQFDMPIYYYTLQQAFILELIDDWRNERRTLWIKISFSIGNKCGSSIDWHTERRNHGAYRISMTGSVVADWSDQDL